MDIERELAIASSGCYQLRLSERFVALLLVRTCMIVIDIPVTIVSRKVLTALGCICFSSFMA